MSPLPQAQGEQGNHPGTTQCMRHELGYVLVPVQHLLPLCLTWIKAVPESAAPVEKGSHGVAMAPCAQYKHQHHHSAAGTPPSAPSSTSLHLSIFPIKTKPTQSISQP